MKRRDSVGLYGGFSKVFDRFLIGGEIFANTNFGKKSTKTVTQTDVITPTANDTLVTKTKSQIKSSYGLDIRPGFMVTDTGAIYLIGGIQKSRARFEVTSTYTGDSDTATLVSKKSRNVTGYRYGIGFQQNLVDNLAARIEYVGVRNTKTSKNTVSGSTSTTGGNVLANSGSFKLKNQHLIKIGLHYYFM
jgi:opacity protein-like surface antigen